MAGDADSKSPSIPAWQTTTSTLTPTPTLTPDEASGSSKTPNIAGQIQSLDRNVLLEKAKIFLKDTSIRNAPREKKLSFLEQKGLQGDEIEKLLDTVSSESSTTPPPPSSTADTIMKTIHDSSDAPPTPNDATSSSPSQSKPAPEPKRDIPPIITYPEYLLRPNKPPPLITLEGLSYSLYTLAGISALTYGASKYLVQPMLQSLTSARHDLANTTLHNLEKLNEKLASNVSHIPPTSTSLPPKPQNLTNTIQENTSDTQSPSLDSDPTELFHRDIATQTSPHLLRSPSLSSTTSRTPSTTNPTTTQTNRLTSLSANLASLLATLTTTTSSSTLSSTITDCQSYLDKLQYSMNSYTDYNLLYGSAPGPTGKEAQPSRNETKPSSREKRGKGEGGGEEEEKTDEAMRFRQEIRSVKGALLSVRSFPVGRPATATATAATVSTTPAASGAAGTGGGIGVGLR
jgi:Pex14 N-terminal domain